MTEQELQQLRFPVGTFQCPKDITETHIEHWIETIARFPKEIIELTQHLSDTEKNWVYRPDGWSIKQVVHHCSDSHMNSLIRFKLALTEEQPTIRPYFEDRWALLNDSLDNDLSCSISLITGLHAKWVKLLRSLNHKQLDRIFVHPEHGQQFTIKENIGIYAWHCEHHLAHIRNALASKGRYNLS